MNYHADQDHRGVFLELWVLDLLGGDYPTALLFSQLLWWHQPGKNGRTRVNHERDGFSWLLRPDDGWEDDCRLTVKQVRRARSVLLERGLVICRRFKLDGAPTTAWRPDHEAIQAAQLEVPPEGNFGNSELPSEGQFLGSDPPGAVPSDPGGAVPIPSSPLVRHQGTAIGPNVGHVAAFEQWYAAYPLHVGRGAAERAYRKAVKVVGNDRDRLLAGALRYRDDPNRDPAFTANPATWLNQERWDDDPLPPRNGTRTIARVDQETLNAMDWARRQEAGDSTSDAGVYSRP